MQNTVYKQRFGNLVSIDLAISIMVDFLLKEGKLKQFVYNCFLYKENGYSNSVTLKGKQLNHLPNREEILREFKYKIEATSKKNGFNHMSSFPLRELWGYYIGSFNWQKTIEGQDFWSKTNGRFKNAVDGIHVEIPKKY